MADDSGAYIPQDHPTNNPEVAEKRKAFRRNLWNIGSAMDDQNPDRVQIAPLADDGKRDPDVIVIPDNKNSV